ncbi:MAG: bifunctional phosphoribosylaminoimidazolecarboxamide formyltransferase/IMP cyclohydrolase, partial [Leptospiraceae bacterium]|nr:bifunctional phosphoribosylaminoimidazolecarboxamide formyltransferase/IMP cyclohydrolase [Leptospiraceae bacterium]
PEMLDGRVKTLHPKIHAGLLADLDKDSHKKDIASQNIESIDLVVVNLYPFAQTISKPNVSLEEAIENIDIGGPAMLRSGAKNYKHTVVVTDISDYEMIQKEMEENEGTVSREGSFRLAYKVFSHTAMYDSLISNYLREFHQEEFPEILNLSFRKQQKLRYGENPHQKAAYYVPHLQSIPFQALQGKELSYNNMLDFDAAFHSAALLPKNSAVIIKHLNPCGVASSETPLDSFLLARRTDPVSAFGGVIGIHGIVDEKLALSITENFVEGVIAEKFTDGAKEIFHKKPNVRIVEIPNFKQALSKYEYRPIHAGLLLQDRDYFEVSIENFKVVSKAKPTDEDIKGLSFAWKVVRLVKSNAIVYTDLNSTLGIGAGQMSRVDSVELGALKAQKSRLSLEGSYVASDAFFPFRDGVDAIAKTKAKAIIQPGGSVRDEEVIQAANEHGLIMIFTGIRHFRH